MAYVTPPNFTYLDPLNKQAFVVKLNILSADIQFLHDSATITLPLTIGQGGTGATTAAGARTNLGLGTMAVQDNSSVAILGGSINGTTIGLTTPAAAAVTTLAITSSGFPLILGGNAATNLYLVLNAAAANQKLIQFWTAGLTRWQVGAQFDAESGGNVGSSFIIARHNDAGTFIDIPLTIARATGLVTLADGLNVTGAIAASGALGGTSLFISNGAASSPVILNANAGQFRYVNIRSANVDRWAFGADNGAEGGANAGSDFYIQALDDAGASLGFPLTIKRSTRAVTLTAIETINVNGDGLLIVNSGGSNGGTEVRAYAAQAKTKMTRVNGTIGSPTTILNNDLMGFVVFHGYDGTVISVNPGAQMYAQATANWTNVSHPTSLIFQTTPAASITPQSNLTLGSDRSGTFDGTLYLPAAGLEIGTNTSPTYITHMNGAAGSQRFLGWQTAGVQRWQFGVNGDAESGGDAGSNFIITSLTDAGGFKSNVVVLDRATSVATIAGLKVSNAFAHQGTTFGTFNATPAVKQTSGADLTNSITAGGVNDTITNWTNLSTYATDAAAIRNAVYQLARKLKQVNDALRVYGMLT